MRSLLDEYGIRPNQAYGQNFLADPNVIQRIVRLANLDPGSNVVEIGGGTGALTVGLAATGAHVVVYEIDSGLVRVLRHTVGALENVEIRHTDAGDVDLGRDLGPGTWSFVSNLPYNVGTGIVLDALRFAPNIDRFVMLVRARGRRAAPRRSWITDLRHPFDRHRAPRQRLDRLRRGAHRLLPGSFRFICRCCIGTPSGSGSRRARS